MQDTQCHTDARELAVDPGPVGLFIHAFPFALPGNSIEYTSSSPSVAYVAGSLLLAKSWCSELFLWLPLSLTLTLFDFGSLTELFGGLLPPDAVV